jgi:hypothetical protein
MWPSVVIARFEIRIAQIRGVHPQRSQNLFAHVVFPTLARHCRDDLARGHVQQIVVSKAAAETGSRLHEPQPVNDVFPRERSVRPEEQIALAQTHPAPVRE